MAEVFKKGDRVVGEIVEVSGGTAYVLLGENHYWVRNASTLIRADPAPTPEEHPAVTKAKELWKEHENEEGEDREEDAYHRGARHVCRSILLEAGYTRRTVTEWVPPCSR